MHARTAGPEMGPFLILAPSSGKLDAPTRKQLRSHVMRGKNRKHPKPRGTALLDSWINDDRSDVAERSPKCALAQSIPPRVGHDLTHIPFVDELNPQTLDLIFKCASTRPLVPPPRILYPSPEHNRALAPPISIQSLPF